MYIISHQIKLYHIISYQIISQGKNVFECYLNKPDATKETFDDDGWFKTGDIVSVDSDGYYKILGRNSVDIIKSAGYKLSALEIETEILSHPKVAEVSKQKID